MYNRNNLHLLLLTGLSFIFSLADAQTGDSLKRKQVQYFVKKLDIDSGLAGRVVSVMDSYSTSVKQVMAIGGMNDSARREKIDLLIAQKNRKLLEMLTPIQLRKVVPTSEMPAAPQASKRHLVDNLKQKLLLNDSIAEKVAAIEEAYKLNIQGISADRSLNDEQKRSLMNAAISEKYHRLGAILSLAQVEKLSPIRNSISKVKPERSVEMASIQDTFERDLKLLTDRKDLSEQAKGIKIHELLVKRHADMTSVIAKQAAAGAAKHKFQF